MKFKFLIAALAIALTGASFAAPLPLPATTVCQVSTPLSVATSSARAALPCSTQTFPVVLIINDGNSEAFFNYGDSTVVATISNIPLPSGSSITIWVGSNSHIAAVTASGSTTLRLVQANGGL